MAARGEADAFSVAEEEEGGEGLAGEGDPGMEERGMVGEEPGGLGAPAVAAMAPAAAAMGAEAAAVPAPAPPGPVAEAAADVVAPAAGPEEVEVKPPPQAGPVAVEGPAAAAAAAGGGLRDAAPLDGDRKDAPPAPAGEPAGAGAIPIAEPAGRDGEAMHAQARALSAAAAAAGPRAVLRPPPPAGPPPVRRSPSPSPPPGHGRQGAAAAARHEGGGLLHVPAAGGRARAGSSSSSGTAFSVEQQRKDEILRMLTAMGFPEVHVHKAIDNVDMLQPHPAEACLAWMELHPMDEELKVEYTESMLQPLVSMGFSRLRAKQALQANDFDVQRAIDYLIAQQAEESAARQRRQESERARQREAEQRRLQRRQEREREEAERERRILLEPPPQLHFGVVVALHCVASRSVLHTSAGDAEELLAAVLPADVASPDPASLVADARFVLKNPQHLDDTGPLLFGAEVALRTVLPGSPGDRTAAAVAPAAAAGPSPPAAGFVAIDADGSVHPNRLELGPFAVWKLRCADAPDSVAAVGPGAVVLLESPLHTFLEAPAAPAAAFARAREPGPSHRFALVFVGVERRRAMHMPTPSAAGAAAAAAAAADGPAAVALPARELWALLRRTFRLRALRMLVEAEDSVREEVERARAALERKQKEERMCSICVDNEPNTVLLECGHICACADCGPALLGKPCPICRSEVQQCVEIER